MCPALSWVAVLIACIVLAACAAPPTPAEVQMMQSAPKPSSPEAAQAAVKRYFEGSMFDAPAARYRFPLSPVQGSFTASQLIGGGREFGWFMCGEINGKNRMGGYTGYQIFFAHFSPTTPDLVIDGTLDDTASHIVADWCKGLYPSTR